MSSTNKKIAIALLALGAWLLPAAQASATAAPAWRFDITSVPTNFVPGSTFAVLGGMPEYNLLATNVGTAPTKGPVTITDTLPAGLTLKNSAVLGGLLGACTNVGSTATCVFPGPIQPGQKINLRIGFNVDGTGTILHQGDTIIDQATLEGGGASAVVATNSTEVSATIAPFEFLPGTPGFGMSPYAEDGTAETLAGGHPHVLSVNASFSTRKLGVNPGAVDGGEREVHSFLPRGMIINPTATPRRCSEVQFEANACPANTQVGVANVLTSLNVPLVIAEPVYNLEPAPGKAADLGFVVVIYPIHAEGGVRPGDYTEEAETKGIPGLFARPATGVQFLFWGDPSAPTFDYARVSSFGDCHSPPCPVPEQDVPFLTMPSSCAGAPVVEAEAVSWEHPNGPPVRRTDVMRDANDNEIGITGCAGLEFNPTLKARPTTNLADSPSGLEVDLEVPQTSSLSQRASAQLRKTVVSLPVGLALNPSSANGLGSCTPSEVGIDVETAVPNGEPVTCPDSAKVGTVEVDSPLVDHPLPGSVYVATPHENPFGTLLALYVVIDDKPSGTLVKLPGRVDADPNTGQLTSTFDENPQLPFSHFKLHFFGGSRGVLRTPATCGPYSTTSELTPWSAPDSGPPATPHDDYEITQSPTGGACPASTGSQPNSPGFEGGTVSPIAASYSPLVIALRRQDDSQEFSSVTLSPPPGLIGKLAGIPYCPASDLAAAEAKTGTEETEHPSCPDASRVGSVHVAAGAGPAPYWTTGTAYLTGPYKGAPLGMAIVTPATAGPYDLGTVVVRTALAVNPETAQITATSDPIPHILDGIPLDVRQILVRLDRNQFTLNGTSCNPLAFTGQLLSTLGQSAALSQRFQLGECAGLAFKPKLSFRLRGKTNRGGDPAFSATLQMPPGSANIAGAQVALPRSEFLDNAHIGTVCTRVQFNEGGGHGEHCPGASVYGFAKASTPLLDQPLEGPVFLRSSDHELPDLVAALKGQISVDLDGRIDSVNGGIRNSFEIVPDAPVSSFTLEMAGGAKGLLENSTNICKGTHRASVTFTAQNGKVAALAPALKNSKCAKHKRHRRPHRAKRHQRHAVR
jgi:uncharacterized repeat protein (TIGR01451 family)